MQAAALFITEYIRVPLKELNYTFARGSGPGGQNVNKVNTKAILTWDVNCSPSLPPAMRERFLVAYANRINSEGHVVIASDKFRDQGRNVSDCMEKLRGMLLTVVYPPKPRVATKPTRGSKEKRIESKKSNSVLKANRKKVRLE